LLTPIPGQDVNIPLVVGGALVVGDTTFSPSTGGLNADESSTGPSIGMNSYDDATIRDCQYRGRRRRRSEGLEYYSGYLRTTTDTPPQFMAEP
jgi:hypothetical protein